MDIQEEISIAYRYQKEGAYDQALASFMRIGMVDGYGEMARREVAKTYKMMNQPAKAIQHFAAAVQKNPFDNEAVKELSETARLSNDLETAIAVLESAAQAGGQPVQLELSKLYIQKGDFAKSLPLLQQMRATDPDNAAIIAGIGKICKAEGRISEAVDAFEKVCALQPGHSEACCELGDIYQKQGEYRTAIGYYQRAAAQNDDRMIHLKLVELHALNNDEEESRKEAQKVLALTPRTPFDQDVMFNETEILLKKTVLQSKVKRLWVTVTTRCNIRCKTCGLWHGKWDLPYKTAVEVMALYPYLERLVWLGGEVFLYKHFEEMFDKAAQHANLHQQVITNGYVLNEQWIEKIVRASNVELTFSVDGTTKEVYESIRQGSNFEKVVANIRRVMAKKKEYGVPLDVRMNAVIMRSNYHQIEEFLEFARREGFNQVSLMALHFDLAPDENIFYDARDTHIVRFIGEAIPRLRKKAKEYNIAIDILLPPGEMDFQEIVNGKDAAAAGRQDTETPPQPAVSHPSAGDAICCKMPWQYMMICDYGKVLLTGSCVQSIGNINEQSLDEIWNSEMAQRYRQCMIDRRFDGLCRAECLSRW